MLDQLVTALAVFCWLIVAALVWRALPLPQPAPRVVARSWGLVALPWRGRLAIGVQLRLFVISR